MKVVFAISKVPSGILILEYSNRAAEEISKHDISNKQRAGEENLRINRVRGRYIDSFPWS